jgi:predicted AAA+ superfamily ATPase
MTIFSSAIPVYCGVFKEIYKTLDGEIFSVIDIEALNAEFINYLNYGGYPEAVLSITAQKDSARYIKSDIIDKVLLRDLPSIYDNL